MNFPVILAHGALGAADEIILIAVAIGFVALMAISFIRSRNVTIDDDDPPTSQEPTDQLDPPKTPDRFRLD